MVLLEPQVEEPMLGLRNALDSAASSSSLSSLRCMQYPMRRAGRMPDEVPIRLLGTPKLWAMRMGSG